MTTLQENAVTTILKFGIPYEEILPKSLEKKIDTVEHTIRRSLTGSEYYAYYPVKDGLEFGISWKHGTWTFIRRDKFKDDDLDQRTVHIQACKETFLSQAWGSFFGLRQEM